MSKRHPEKQQSKKFCGSKEKYFHKYLDDKTKEVEKKRSGEKKYIKASKFNRLFPLRESQ